MNHSPLAAAQLALLNQATITIADLADGYLALTLGTTITLDTDAAGYGWFVDPTPFTNEEFVNEGSMVNGQSGRILHGWRFTIHVCRRGALAILCQARQRRRRQDRSHDGAQL